MKDIILLKDEELVAHAKPWPMKDAKTVWNRLQNDLTIKEFNTLVLVYLTNLNWWRQGRPTELEKLAKAVLFEMSSKQREVAYRIIFNRIKAIKDHGWWTDNISKLTAQKANMNNRGKFVKQATGFSHKILEKKKRAVEDSVIRVKLDELTSVIDQHKEYAVIYVNTMNGHDYVNHFRYSNYDEAKVEYDNLLDNYLLAKPFYLVD